MQYFLMGLIFGFIFGWAFGHHQSGAWHRSKGLRFTECRRPECRRSYLEAASTAEKLKDFYCSKECEDLHRPTLEKYQEEWREKLATREKRNEG